MSKSYQLLDQLPMPIVVIDSKSNFIYYNNMFVSFCQLSPRVLKKRKKFTDVVKIKNDIFNNLIKSAISEDRSIVSEELDATLAAVVQEMIYIVIKATPQRVGTEREEVLISINDMTLEYKLQDKYQIKLNELKELHGQLQQADKLATLGEINANITHEVNNPLTVAMGVSEQLLISINRNPSKLNYDRIKKNANSIFNALTKIQLIMTNMSIYAYKGHNKKEYFDLISIMKGSIDLIVTIYKKEKISIEFQSQTEKILTFNNKIEIQQVFVNLLNNAKDAIKIVCKKNGCVKISIINNKTENCIDVEIEDNGPGIPKNIQEQIFNPFFTTKPVGKGTGLGLPICKRIMEEHQGDIFIKSSSSKGTKFIVRLPLVEVGSFVLNDNLMENLIDNTSVRILVVDDESEILNLFQQIFDGDGFSMIGSSSSSEALKLLDKFQIDLIISDYNLSTTTATEFAKKIRKKLPIVPILYLTSPKFVKHFEEDKDSLNISGIITKPFEKDSIIKLVQKTLHNKRD